MIKKSTKKIEEPKKTKKMSLEKRLRITDLKKEEASSAIVAALVKAGVPEAFARGEAENATRQIGEDLEGCLPSIVYGQAYLHVNNGGATFTVGNDDCSGPYVEVSYNHFGHTVNRMRLYVSKSAFDDLATLFAGAKEMKFGEEYCDAVNDSMSSLRECRVEGYKI